MFCNVKMIVNLVNVKQVCCTNIIYRKSTCIITLRCANNFIKQIRATLIDVVLV